MSTERGRWRWLELAVAFPLIVVLVAWERLLGRAEFAAYIQDDHRRAWRDWAAVRLPYGVLTIGEPQVPYTRYARLFWRWSPAERLLRLGRVVWSSGGGPNKNGTGYSASVSWAVTTRLRVFGLTRTELSSWKLVILFVRLHYQRSYGGWIV